MTMGKKNIAQSLNYTCILFLLLLVHVISISGTSFSFYDDLRIDIETTNIASATPFFNDSAFMGRNLHLLDFKDPSDAIDGHDNIILCHIPTFLRYTNELNPAAGQKSTCNIAYSASAGAMLAMYHFNNGNGSVVPEFNNINKKCKLRFTTEIFDSGSSPLNAFQTLTKMLARSPYSVEMPQPCAIFGSQISTVTSKLATLSSVFDLFQVSSSAMSAELENVVQYPLFARSHTDVSGFGEMSVSFLQEVIGINQFCLLIPNDSYGLSFQKSILEEAAKYGMITKESSYLGTLSSLADIKVEIRNALNTLKESRCNYFIAAFYPELLSIIMGTAYELDMVGPGKFWLMSGTADTAPHILSGTFTVPKDSSAAKAIVGNGLIFCKGGISNLIGSYDKFVTEWSEISESTEALDFINSKQPVLSDKDSKCAPPPKLFKNLPHHIVTYSYDAIVGIALSACDVLRSSKTYPIFSGKENRDSFARNSFQGASGNFVLRSDFPTRTAASSYFVMVNMAKNDYNETHILFKGSKLSYYYDTQNKEWKNVNEFIFADGSTTPPKELQPDPRDSLDTILTVVFVVAGSVIIILATLYFIRKRAKDDIFWNVQVDELAFDDPVEIIGRGTFGLVLLARYRGTEVAIKKVLPPKEMLGTTRMFTKSTLDSVNSETQKAKNSNGNLSDVLVTRDGVIGSSDEKLDIRHEKRRRLFFSLFRRKNESKTSTTSIVEKDIEAVENDIPYVSTAPSTEKLRTIGIKTTDFSLIEGENTNDPLNRRLSNGVKTLAYTDRNMAVVNGSKSSVVDRSSEIYPSLQSKASILKRLRSYGFMKTIRRVNNHEILRQDFINEMRVLSKLRHPCITTVMGAVLDNIHEPMLVMEYMNHGSLCDILHNKTIYLDSEITFPFLQDISQGIRFLHTANPQIIHGDIKAANVLVDSKFRAKVADFGLSQKKMVGASGTPYWMSPELLRGDSDNTTASDVYSFGILLYEVFSRQHPYEGENYDDVMKDIKDQSINKRPIPPEDCPPQFKVMMQECCLEDPEKRPNSEEINERIKRFGLDLVGQGGQGMELSQPFQNHSHHKTNKLLLDVFPQHVAEALRHGQKVEPTSHDMVTIFFSDIVGFTTISSTLTPLKIADMLDRLYQKFDALSQKYDVFKVETIGDAYMAVTNLVKCQSNHTKLIAEFALDAVKASNSTLIDTSDPSMGYVRIRVGFHSGPVVANVVGSRNPRYCLFGDTVNTASRMESHSKENRIHCSERAAMNLVGQNCNLEIKPRGKIAVKGKGEMDTFWVCEKSLNEDAA